MKIPTAQLFQLMSLPYVLPLSAFNSDIHWDGYNAHWWRQEIFIRRAFPLGGPPDAPSNDGISQSTETDIKL